MTPEERAAERARYSNGEAIEPAGRSANFYHGTSSSLSSYAPGEHIDPGLPHSKVHDVSMSNSVYFTSDKNRADFYASKAVEKHGGDPVVYRVTPTGKHSQDIHNRRTPENRMTSSPLKVEGQENWHDWSQTHREI